ncbi:MAG: hypothetical protein HXX09_04550 [Bacteroidetes bacterium]|nr:hypothetical protein [Bacteroidota bacterium]
MKKLIILFILPFIFIFEKGYCQQPTDSIKFLLVEKTIEKHSKQQILSHEFSNSQKVTVSLENTKVKGVLHDISDSTFFIGNSECFRIKDIKKISRYRSPVLILTGAGMVVVGIAFIGISAFNGNLSLLADGFGTASLGLLPATAGIIQSLARKNYSIKKGWKIKVNSKPALEL